MRITTKMLPKTRRWQKISKVASKVAICNGYSSIGCIIIERRETNREKWGVVDWVEAETPILLFPYFVQ